MILPSIIILCTLFYREIGGNITQKNLVRGKRQIDYSFYQLYKRMKEPRYRRSTALLMIFKGVAGFLFLFLILLIFVGKNSQFTIEIFFWFLFFLTLIFGFKTKSDLIKEIYWILGFSVLVFFMLLAMHYNHKPNPDLELFMDISSHYFGDNLWIQFSAITILTFITVVMLRLLLGFFNEFIYLAIALIIRFSFFLGKEKALNVMLFLASSISFIIAVLTDYFYKTK